LGGDTGEYIEYLNADLHFRRDSCGCVHELLCNRVRRRDQHARFGPVAKMLRRFFWNKDAHPVCSAGCAI